MRFSLFSIYLLASKSNEWVRRCVANNVFSHSYQTWKHWFECKKILIGWIQLTARSNWKFTYSCQISLRIFKIFFFSSNNWNTYWEFVFISNKLIQNASIRDGESVWISFCLIDGSFISLILFSDVCYYYGRHN